MENTKFYQKNWFIWLVLIIFFPVGVFLLWKYSQYSKISKVLISIVVLIFCIVVYTPTEKIEIKADTESVKEEINNIQKTEIKKETLLKYEVLEIKELSHNRLSLKVLVKENPTVERLTELSNHLVKAYFSDNIYGIYIGYTHHPDATFTYGQVEYGPEGSAGYKENNIGKENQLNTSMLQVASNEYMESVNNSIKNEKVNKPKKEILRKHILNLLKNDNINIDTFDITSFEDGFEVSFDVSANEVNLEKVGVDTIKKILTSKLPSPVMSVYLVVLNKYQTIIVGYNGEKYYKVEGGKTIDIE